MLCLSEADRRAALELARKAIREAVLHRGLPEVIPSEGVFSEQCGVFVTLHVQGRLKGCIGVTEPSETFGTSIVCCAVWATIVDYGIPPLQTLGLVYVPVHKSLHFTL